MFFNVTCISVDAPSLSGSTQDEFILFTQADGVRAGIDYTCHVTMTVTAYNGTTVPDDPAGQGFIETQTTPISEKVSITTLEGKGKIFVVGSTFDRRKVQCPYSYICSCVQLKSGKNISFLFPETT